MAVGPSISVDLAAITSVTHACRACTRTRGCCCASYEVCVTEREMRAMIGAMPAAAGFCPTLSAPDGFRNVFDEIEDGLFCIDTHENGLCVFAYRSRGHLRCALHSAAEKLGVPPATIKPSVCVLWPLMLSEPPGRLLSIADDALRFPCCGPRSGEGRRGVSEALLESVDALFGPAAGRELSRSARRGLCRTRISVARRPGFPGAYGVS